MEASGGSLGHFGGHVEHIGGHLGDIRGHVGDLGGHLGDLGSYLRDLGGHLAHLRCHPGAQTIPGAKYLVKYRSKSTSRSPRLHGTHPRWTLTCILRGILHLRRPSPARKTGGGGGRQTRPRGRENKGGGTRLKANRLYLAAWLPPRGLADFYVFVLLLSCCCFC